MCQNTKYNILKYVWANICIVTFICKAVFVPAMLHFQNTICGANMANNKNCKVGQSVKLCSPYFFLHFFMLHYFIIKKSTFNL